MTEDEQPSAPSEPDAAEHVAAPPAEDAPTPTRVCPHCSTLSQTAGDFCPHCGKSLLHTPRRISRKALLITGAVIVLLLLVAGGVGFSVKHSHDQAAKKRQLAQTAAAAAKRAETQAQIAERHNAEFDMQAAITKWANKQVSSGVLDEAILRTSCQPVGGGSENLSEITVKYDCLAITTDNADGTSSGYSVHATMDFSTGQCQWGLGNS